GIDIKKHHIKKSARTAPKSDDVYLRLLVKFNKVVLKRLFMSRVNRPPVSISRIVKNCKELEGKIITIVGTVTTMNAFSSLLSVLLRAKIACFFAVARTLERLSVISELLVFPRVMLKPYVRSKGRKFERARGRRASRGYKN
ncbi:hypothetical protein L0F63_005819, partial [Massospora cicadina]